MLLVSRNPFVFVGKKELGGIPIFGFFYKRVCILVDRDSVKSRTGVYRRAPEEHIVLDKFKDGAFKMAIAHKIPVVPMTFLDNKKRFSFTFFSGGPGRIRAIVHPFFETGILAASDTSTMREEVRQVILEDLEKN